MKPPRLRVDGVVLLNKPKGLSSNIALQKVRHLYRAEKAGHTGTLDPEATGLLPVCLGEATKFSSVLLDAVKGYTAEIVLGQTSSTGDAEGEIVPTGVEVPQDPMALSACLQTFLGPQWQIPPMHSALKHAGKALYEYAREGLEIERQARQVEIYALDLLSASDSRLTVHVMCSKGTYIRVLAQDIGKRLGCGGWLGALHRTHTGGFTVEKAYTLTALQEMTEAERMGIRLPVDSLILDFARLDLDPETAQRLKMGQSPRIEGYPDGELIYRAYLGETFVGLVQVVNEGRVKAKRMMATSV